MFDAKATSRIKVILRCLVVKTSFPSFVCIYKMYYQIALKIIVFVLKRHTNILSIYLVGGLTQKNHIYGLSDIDLIIILKNNSLNREGIDKSYHRLSILFPILKYAERSIYGIQEIAHIRKGCRFSDYKFYELVKTGKLLYGRDVVAEIYKTETIESRKHALGLCEGLWHIFVKNFLADKPNDAILKNYLLYKISMNSVKSLVWVKNGREPCDSFWAPIQAKAYARYARRDNLENMKRTYRLCFEAIDETARCINIISDDEAGKMIQSRLDFSFDSLDLLITEENKNKIGTIVNLIKDSCAGYIDTIFAAPFDFLGINEREIAVFLYQKSLLPLEMVAKIKTIAKSNRCRQGIYLYLVSGHVALSLDRYDLPKTLLTPDRTPLTFLFLSSPASVIYGRSLLSFDKEVLLRHTRTVFKRLIERDERSIIQTLQNRSIFKVAKDAFHLFFWQALQLKFINDFSMPGVCSIPLSSWQVCRSWYTREPARFGWLLDFYEEYKKDLKGAISNTDAYFTCALKTLRELYLTENSTVTNHYGASEA